VLLQLPENPEDLVPIMREIRETVPTRIMVVGPAAEAKTILRILREGAFQYIDQDDLETELRAALVRLRSEPKLTADFGHVIAVLGAGGGSGATTLAVNLGTCLARGKRACALLDFKLEAGDAASLLDAQPEHSLADFCRNAARMDEAMFDECLTRHASGVCLLAAPKSFRELRYVTPRGVRKALNMARRTFPYVVVDLDASFRPETSQALFQSDIVLLVIRLDFTSVRQGQKLLEHLRELQIDEQRVRLVVNRHRRPRELRVSDVQKALGLQVFKFIPDDARRVNRANNRGVPVVVDSPTAAVARSMLDVAKCVNGRVASTEEVEIPNAH
jgi:pilus assembly protein CpaE